MKITLSTDGAATRRGLLGGAAALLAAGAWPGSRAAAGQANTHGFKPIRFVVVNDTHHEDRDCDAWMEALFRQIARTENAVACLGLGDLANRGTLESLRAMRRLSEFSGMPFLPCPGNHDLDESPVSGHYESVFPGRSRWTGPARAGFSTLPRRRCSKQASTSRRLPFTIRRRTSHAPRPMSAHWPSFWPDVPDDDRPAIREILAELLARGVLLGTTGAGRDLFLLARDHYQRHLADYLAPLGLELIVDDDFQLLQARPRPEACQLLSKFSKDETLILLVLWRVWDDHRTHEAASAVILTVDELWTRFRNTFDRIDPPEKTHLDSVLSRLKRLRLIRTHKPDGAQQLGETLIEILPSLPRVIPFDSLESCLTRAALYQPQSVEGTLEI